VTDDERLLAERYRLGDLIGRGGMSTVHRAVDTRLRRVVAVKLLKPQLATNPSFRMRFRQEAQASSRMTHPTIVRIYDAGEETSRDSAGHDVQVPFIVMEYVEGRLVKDILDDGPLTPSAAAHIAEGVLTALEYSHRAGVVHRDIKPGNVMVTASGQVKVMDFGIARAVTESTSNVAQTTSILGTAAYFSPEQARGESVDARTDLYSTGVMLFEMLTGVQPFRADTPVAVAYQHLSETPPAPSSFNPKVSPAFDVVVERALQKGRTQRYQTVAEFRADVLAAAAGRVPLHREPDQTEVLFGTPVTTPTSSEFALRQLTEDETTVRTQRRPPAVWVWAGIVATLVIVAAVMYWAFNLQPSAPLPPNVRTIPPLAQLSYEDAVTKLKEIGLNSTRADQPSATAAKDAIIRSDPAAGEKVDSDTVVKLYVSAGPLPVVTPDVRNKNINQAKTDLTAAGLNPGTESRVNSPSIVADIVISTDPAPDSTVAAGATINLQVSTGKVTLPDFVGKPQATVASTLISDDLQLTADLKPDNTCGSEAGAPITRQSPPPGEVPQHSTVQIFYCTG